MTVNGTTTTPPADRQRRRAELIAGIVAQSEVSRLTLPETVRLTFDVAMTELRAIQAEAEARAQADLAARDDGTRPPSRPNVPPKAVEYYAELGGESGGA